ncbi:MAG TPA: 3-oxoacyl-[acyl-carrier-protein] synthase III C-terminal domain-containing protein [Kofleriaceae bacterium]|jgi:3-oxoacyl-[acyl-carrier-protein] synthase-3
MAAIGILGIGVHLPPERRSNDWWPPEVVARWAATPRLPPPELPPDLTPAARRIIDALKRQARDPFFGAVARSVIAPDVSLTAMAAAAATEALARAGIAPADVDLVLMHAVGPEFLATNQATAVHRALGLATRCLALDVDAGAYSFLGHLALAHGMIESGRARVALLVQAGAPTRLVDPHDETAPYYGDCATAVVVGPAARGGLLAEVHETDGRYPNTHVVATPEGPWYGAGRAALELRDRRGMNEVLLQTVDLSARVVGAALAAARRSAADVRFFAVHQPAPWLRQLAAEESGLAHAATVETFADTGYIFSSILPVGLRRAQDQGLLAPGDLVVLFAGGTGMIYGAAVLEWSS